MSRPENVEFTLLSGFSDDESDSDDLDLDHDHLDSHSRVKYKKFDVIQDKDTDPGKTSICSKVLVKLYVLFLIGIILFAIDQVFLHNNPDPEVPRVNSHQAAARISPQQPQLPFSIPPPLFSNNQRVIISNHEHLETVINDINLKLSAKTLTPKYTKSKSSSINDTLPSSSSHPYNSNSNKEYYRVGTPIQSYETYMDTVIQERNTVDKPDQLDDMRVSPNEHYKIAKWWTINHRNAKKYVTISNYIRAIKSFDHDSSVTYTTQASTNFLHHTVEICKRWDGPISLAVFGTGQNFNNSITIIKYMRDCLPSPLSSCIRDKVSWHIIYESDGGLKPESLNYPNQHMNYGNFKAFVEHDECPKMKSQDAKLMIKEFSERLANSSLPESRHLYPINVLRNTARLASTTKHLLACDIELYPSVNLVPLFSNYISRHNPTDEYGAKKYIFALPIFELKANVTPPKTKRQLAKQFERGDAIFFHKFVCDYCQDFPNRIGWIKSLDRSDDDELSIFVKAQRDKSRSSWEPIFIGTNDDPLYDDRLTWDGRRDKMGQMYEMCLQDYYILIVDNAFLVHSPGIKHIDKADVMNRVQYIMSNNQIYETTMTQLKKSYANNDTINKC